jgi:arylsulfatase A-like enzyme
VLLGLALLTAFAACRGERLPSVENAVLISIDTLRADYLGAYGHPYVKTPHIDALAAEGVTFDRVVAPAPTTLVSHTSLMTGTYPHTHGVPNNANKVSDANRMLAEVLQEAGFRTAGLVGGFPLAPHTRFNQGFEHYRYVPGKPIRQQSGEQVTDAVLEWLDSREPGRFFLFVHYWDVHWPYEPPPPYDRMYGDETQRIAGNKREINRTRRALRRGQPRAARRSEILKLRYAGEVSYVDAQIGRLIAGLRERDLLESSVVLLTADHGEAMDEHPAELWNHGNTLYDSVARIPLILRLPGGALAGSRRDWTLSAIDLMPTLLELLGQPPQAGVEGVSFAAALAEGTAPERGPVFAQATKPHRRRYERGRAWKNADKCRGVWEANWKLMHCPLRGRFGGLRELYDVSTDPGEQLDLLGSDDPVSREIGRRLADDLSAWSRRSDPLPTIVEESEEVIEELRALGYVD